MNYDLADYIFSVDIVEGVTTSTNPVRGVDEDEEMPSQSFKLSYTQGSSPF